MIPSPLHIGTSACLPCGRFCVLSHSWFEFMGTEAVLCPEILFCSGSPWPLALQSFRTLFWVLELCGEGVDMI